MSLLKAEKLAKSYRGKQAVKQVSLTVESGQVVGLLGPNGAGKTTCFYMIVGSVSHHEGRVLLDERDLTGCAVHERAKAGLAYLPQEASVFRKLTVKENLMAILETRRDLTRAARQERAQALMAEFRVEHLHDSLGLTLSGGERRRVEIARALTTDPAFILLDEPFAGVDPISVTDIKNIIRQLAQRGIGMLITDHNVRETLDICEKAYIVNKGQVMAEGHPKDILKDDQVRQVYLGHDFKL